jgi:hypothetical protein
MARMTLAKLGALVVAGGLACSSAVREHTAAAPPARTPSGVATDHAAFSIDLAWVALEPRIERIVRAAAPVCSVTIASVREAAGREHVVLHVHAPTVPQPELEARIGEAATAAGFVVVRRDRDVVFDTQQHLDAGRTDGEIMHGWVYISVREARIADVLRAVERRWQLASASLLDQLVDRADTLLVTQTAGGKVEVSLRVPGEPDAPRATMRTWAQRHGLERDLGDWRTPRDAATASTISLHDGDPDAPDPQFLSVAETFGAGPADPACAEPR